MAQVEMGSNPFSRRIAAIEGTVPLREKSSGVAPRMLTAFFRFVALRSVMRSAIAARASDAPHRYERMPLVPKAKQGIPLRASTSAAIARRSQPVIIGIGVPAMAANLGWSRPIVSTISPITFSSSPMIASISVSAEMKIRLREPYQRGSSWVL